MFLVFFVEPLYDVVGSKSSQSNDGSSPEIVLLNPFVYFGRHYSQIYVCFVFVFKLILLLKVFK